jgi:hypothetical protein
LRAESFETGCIQASVLSSAIALALKVAKHLDASAVLVNVHTAFRTDWIPFADGRDKRSGGIPWMAEEMAGDKMVLFNQVTWGRLALGTPFYRANNCAMPKALR